MVNDDNISTSYMVP